MRGTRFAHYLSLVLMVAGFSLGGWVTMGCSPQLTIPTGQLAAGQEGVVMDDEGGILFDTASTLESASYELPAEVQYRGQMIPINRWVAITSAEGDRVSGNTGIVANNLTSASTHRTASFLGFWDVPGNIPETREIKYHIRVGLF